MRSHLLAVVLARDPRVHRLHPRRHTGGTHPGEDTGEVRPRLRGIEEGVLPLPNREVQRALCDMIVERCAGRLQNPRERIPMVQPIRDRLPQTALGFHQSPPRLLLHPRLERREDRRPLRLMVHSAFLCAQLFLPCLVLLGGPQLARRHHPRTLRREVLG
jgi:hypothetical protein